jgi:hypothetical protein
MLSATDIILPEFTPLLSQEDILENPVACSVRKETPAPVKKATPVPVWQATPAAVFRRASTSPLTSDSEDSDPENLPPRRMPFSTAVRNLIPRPTGVQKGVEHHLDLDPKTLKDIKVRHTSFPCSRRPC